MFQITHLEIESGFNLFCALEMLKLISKNRKLKAATDNTVNKLNSHMIRISKEKE